MSIESEVPFQRQAAFGQDGELEVESRILETTLAEHGVDIDLNRPSSRIDRPASDEFVDDRLEMAHLDVSEQGALFASDDDAQVTLEGDSASVRCLFE
jgi:hypothetical protein